MTAGRIAAVVLNWKDHERTCRCVGSLIDEDLVDSIIVVDNESDGQLRESLHEARAEVTVLEQHENRGFAGGVNPGLEAVLARRETEFVLCINNDAVLTSGALGLMMTEIERDRRVGLVGPRIVDANGATISTGGSFRAISASTKDLSAREPDYVTWACVLVRREVFDEVGLLDDGFFMYWEDVEFGLRAASAGFLLRVATHATVLHELSASHSRAGGKVQGYSSYGLVHLARVRGGLTAIGAAYRVLGRVASALARWDRVTAARIARSAILASRASHDEPAWAALARAGLL